MFTIYFLGFILAFCPGRTIGQTSRQRQWMQQRPGLKLQGQQVQSIQDYGQIRNRYQNISETGKRVAEQQPTNLPHNNTDSIYRGSHSTMIRTKLRSDRIPPSTFGNTRARNIINRLPGQRRVIQNRHILLRHILGSRRSESNNNFGSSNGQERHTDPGHVSETNQPIQSLTRNIPQHHQLREGSRHTVANILPSINQRSPSLRNQNQNSFQQNIQRPQQLQNPLRNSRVIQNQLRRTQNFRQRPMGRRQNNNVHIQRSLLPVSNFDRRHNRIPQRRLLPIPKNRGITQNSNSLYNQSNISFKTGHHIEIDKPKITDNTSYGHSSTFVNTDMLGVDGSPKRNNNDNEKKSMFEKHSEGYKEDQKSRKTPQINMLIHQPDLTNINIKSTTEFFVPDRNDRFDTPAVLYTESLKESQPGHTKIQSDGILTNDRNITATAESFVPDRSIRFDAPAALHPASLKNSQRHDSKRGRLEVSNFKSLVRNRKFQKDAIPMETYPSGFPKIDIVRNQTLAELTKPEMHGDQTIVITNGYRKETSVHDSSDSRSHIVWIWPGDEKQNMKFLKHQSHTTAPPKDHLGFFWPDFTSAHRYGQRKEVSKKSFKIDSKPIENATPTSTGLVKQKKRRKLKVKRRRKKKKLDVKTKNDSVSLLGESLINYQLDLSTQLPFNQDTLSAVKTLNHNPAISHRTESISQLVDTVPSMKVGILSTINNDTSKHPNISNLDDFKIRISTDMLSPMNLTLLSENVSQISNVGNNSSKVSFELDTETYNTQPPTMLKTDITAPSLRSTKDTKPLLTTEKHFVKSNMVGDNISSGQLPSLIINTNSKIEGNEHHNFKKMLNVNRVMAPITTTSQSPDPHDLAKSLHDMKNMKTIEMPMKPHAYLDINQIRISPDQQSVFNDLPEIKHGNLLHLKNDKSTKEVSFTPINGTTSPVPDVTRGIGIDLLGRNTTFEIRQVDSQTKNRSVEMTTPKPTLPELDTKYTQMKMVPTLPTDKTAYQPVSISRIKPIPEYVFISNSSSTDHTASSVLSNQPKPTLTPSMLSATVNRQVGPLMHIQTQDFSNISATNAINETMITQYKDVTKIHDSVRLNITRTNTDTIQKNEGTTEFRYQNLDSSLSGIPIPPYLPDASIFHGTTENADRNRISDVYSHMKPNDNSPGEMHTSIDSNTNKVVTSPNSLDLFTHSTDNGYDSRLNVIFPVKNIIPTPSSNIPETNSITETMTTRYKDATKIHDSPRLNIAKTGTNAIQINQGTTDFRFENLDSLPSGKPIPLYLLDANTIHSTTETADKNRLRDVMQMKPIDDSLGKIHTFIDSNTIKITSPSSLDQITNSTDSAYASHPNTPFPVKNIIPARSNIEDLAQKSHTIVPSRGRSLSTVNATNFYTTVDGINISKEKLVQDESFKQTKSLHTEMSLGNNEDRKRPQARNLFLNNRIQRHHLPLQNSSIQVTRNATTGDFFGMNSIFGMDHATPVTTSISQISTKEPQNPEFELTRSTVASLAGIQKMANDTQRESPIDFFRNSEEKVTTPLSQLSEQKPVIVGLTTPPNRISGKLSPILPSLLDVDTSSSSRWFQNKLRLFANQKFSQTVDMLPQNREFEWIHSTTPSSLEGIQKMVNGTKMESSTGFSYNLGEKVKVKDKTFRISEPFKPASFSNQVREEIPVDFSKERGKPKGRNKPREQYPLTLDNSHIPDTQKIITDVRTTFATNSAGNNSPASTSTPPTKPISTVFTKLSTTTSLFDIMTNMRNVENSNNSLAAPKKSRIRPEESRNKTNGSHLIHNPISSQNPNILQKQNAYSNNISVPFSWMVGIKNNVHENQIESPVGVSRTPQNIDFKEHAFNDAIQTFTVMPTTDIFPHAETTIIEQSNTNKSTSLSQQNNLFAEETLPRQNSTSYNFNVQSNVHDQQIEEPVYVSKYSPNKFEVKIEASSEQPELLEASSLSPVTENQIQVTPFFLKFQTKLTTSTAENVPRTTPTFRFDDISTESPSQKSNLFAEETLPRQKSASYNNSVQSNLHDTQIEQTVAVSKYPPKLTFQTKSKTENVQGTTPAFPFDGIPTVSHSTTKDKSKQLPDVASFSTERILLIEELDFHNFVSTNTRYGSPTVDNSPPSPKPNISIKVIDVSTAEAPTRKHITTEKRGKLKKLVLSNIGKPNETKRGPITRNPFIFETKAFRNSLEESTGKYVTKLKELLSVTQKPDIDRGSTIRNPFIFETTTFRNPFLLPLVRNPFLARVQNIRPEFVRKSPTKDLVKINEKTPKPLPSRNPFLSPLRSNPFHPPKQMTNPHFAFGPFSMNKVKTKTQNSSSGWSESRETNVFNTKDTPTTVNPLYQPFSQPRLDEMSSTMAQNSYGQPTLKTYMDEFASSTTASEFKWGGPTTMNISNIRDMPSTEKPFSLPPLHTIITPATVPSESTPAEEESTTRIVLTGSPSEGLATPDLKPNRVPEQILLDVLKKVVAGSGKTGYDKAVEASLLQQTQKNILNYLLARVGDTSPPKLPPSTTSSPISTTDAFGILYDYYRDNFEYGEQPLKNYYYYY